jgi:hypothetical protein
MPSTTIYAWHFGSLSRAYEIVGFDINRYSRYRESHRLLRRFHPEIIVETKNKIANLGGIVKFDACTGLLTINDEFSVFLVLARCRTHNTGRKSWEIRVNPDLTPDITVVVRLDQDNRRPIDYYLLPRLEFGKPRITLADQNSVEFESYRFESLDYFFGMAARTQLRNAA